MLLSNRLAYSLAKSPAQRRDLLDEFKRIYDTRSAIVHRGKADLTDEEEYQLRWLRYFCRLLINHELDLLEKAN